MDTAPVDAATTAACGTAVVLTMACAAAAIVYPVRAWSIVLPVVAVVYVSVPVVGAAMARSQPRNPVGWILVASGVGFPLACTGYLLAEAAYTAGADVPFAAWAGWLDGWPWVPALGLVPTLGLLLFPDGRPPSPRWRPFLWLCCAQAIMLFLGLLLSPTLSDFPEHDNPTGLAGEWGTAAAGLSAVIALMAPLSTVAAWSVHRRRARTTDPRQLAALNLVQPAAWLLAAAWWGCIALISFGGESIDATPAEVSGMLALAGTAWVAIRRYGLFDGRRVLSATMAYGLLTVLVFTVYLGVAAVVRLLTSEAVSEALAVVAATLVALPLRDVLQRAVNRIVYGYRDDPAGALVQLSRRLEAAALPEEVLPSVARTVQAALRVPYVEVRLGQNVRACAGDPSGDPPEEFPLVFAGETVGTLAVAGRDPGGAFTPGERRLLSGLAGQIAAAGHAVSLTADLLRSRERLVSALEEERRRLRRDLHDGLGPALAGTVLGLQRARSRLATDADAVAGQLNELTAQVQEAVAEIRRLVYGLRPPALDELGLIGALREQARTLGPFVVEGPQEEPVLPAAVEVAAYRIALEAMTNAARHAHAGRGTVRISAGTALHLEINDDGIGIPDGYRAGVGITSMRERAAELGGTCLVERATPNGTTIRATLPLSPARTPAETS
ncbi:GAF domain-containing sensor histidine kinase [Actinomadura sp. ATCC 39365]|uniref:sensor histidine kinase n=1 Tax=Nonomuraea sp. NPDC005692 TaxID=3157168 RepID=UPI0033E0B060